jgi:hypothetical protein
MKHKKNRKYEIIKYGGTAHNRTVYAPLPSVAPGFRSARSVATLLPTPHSGTFGGTKPYGFLYSAAQTS